MRFITKPNGEPCSLTEYVRSWKHIKAVHPNAMISNWDYFPAEAWTILQEICRGMHDRINQRGGVKIFEENITRTIRRASQRVVVECRWCGQPMAFAEVSRRFCSPDCRAAHRG